MTNNDESSWKHVEDSLWATAEELRGSVEAAEYKHIVLGLLFLKHVSDSFEERRSELKRLIAKKSVEHLPKDLDNPEEYWQSNSFYVPEEARWSSLVASAGQPNLGKKIDESMILIEDSNREQLRGVLPKIYLSSPVTDESLSELIRLLTDVGVGTLDVISRDTFGRAYEFFIKKFAQTEGKRGGEFFTPSSVVKLLVEILEPYSGRVYDPFCGSGGMFVQSIRFIESHKGKKENISIYGQEKAEANWRICKMNLAIRGIEANIYRGDTLHDHKFDGMKFDRVIANPPFNMKVYGGERLAGDKRMVYGPPPPRNANYAFIQHMISSLDNDGMAGFVMANGSMTASGNAELKIRTGMIDDDIVDCMISLPNQLFYTVQIPACLWFLSKNKSGDGHRNRKGETLFIDARKIFNRIDRVQKELTDDQIQKIANTYRSYRGDKNSAKYEDVKGYCKASTTEEIKENDYMLTPGLYVGIPPTPPDPPGYFEKEMKRLTAELEEQFKKSAELEQEIQKNLDRLKAK